MGDKADRLARKADRLDQEAKVKVTPRSNGTNVKAEEARAVRKMEKAYRRSGR